MGENSVAKGKVGFSFLHVGWEKRVAQPSEIDYSAHAWLFKSSNSLCWHISGGHYGDFPYSQ